MTKALPKLLRNAAVKKIKSSNGKIFRVKVRKRDGTERWMRCRTGVSKYVKGVGRNYTDKDANVITVYDMDAAAEDNPERAYRTIAVEGILQLKIDHVRYKVVNKK